MGTSLTDTLNKQQYRLRRIHMTNKRKPYNTYTREFKIKALSLMEGSGKPPAKLAMELGIRRNQR